MGRLRFTLNGRCPHGFSLLTKRHQSKDSKTYFTAQATCSASEAFALVLGFPEPFGKKISFVPTLEEISKQMPIFLNVPLICNNERITLRIRLGPMATRRTFYTCNVKLSKETLLKSGKLRVEQLPVIFTKLRPPEGTVQPRELFSQGRFPLFP